MSLCADVSQGEAEKYSGRGSFTSPPPAPAITYQSTQIHDYKTVGDGITNHYPLSALRIGFAQG